MNEPVPFAQARLARRVAGPTKCLAGLTRSPAGCGNLIFNQETAVKSFWQPETRRELQIRIAKLTPASQPKWGRMSAPQMVIHLTDSIRMACGDLRVASKGGLLRYPPLKQLIIYYLPWPENTPTAPELLARAPDNWATDLAELTTMIDRFATRDINGPWPEHPVFGRLSGRHWGFLGWRHTDHHLRQFNV
jgi:Protein of unknown function (DUF1569)